MNFDKINFIFFGRFEEGKWFDMIIDLIDTLYQDKRAWRNKIIDQVRFFIFWDWTLKNRFLLKLDNLIHNMEDFQSDDKVVFSNKPVYYFWWKDRTIIDRFLSKSQFCIMPSTFLETFWLTALESLSNGVPVIWFWKWWLNQFLLDWMDISNIDWFNNFDKFYTLISNIVKRFNPEYWQDLSILATSISENYSKSQWLSKFKSISHWTKKILLVSDYMINIWWIESYIFKVSDLLKSQWYEVETLWWEWFTWKVTFLDRLLWLPITAFNFVFKIKLENKIRTFKPDLIWFHSVHRFLGWYIFKGLKDYRGKIFMMYHDFWFFHPYPSNLNNENDLLYSFNLKNFLIAANTFNPLKLVSVLLKFLACSLLRKQLLKNVDFHLVPSEFMLETLRNYWVPIDEYLVLPHFKD